MECRRQTTAKVKSLQGEGLGHVRRGRGKVLALACGRGASPWESHLSALWKDTRCKSSSLPSPEWRGD